MTTLADRLETILPSEDDVCFYRENGFYLSKKLFTDEEIDAALQAADDFYKGRFDLDPLPGKRHHGWSEEAGDVLRKNDHASFRMKGLQTLTHSALIGAVAARLSGAEEIRLWHDQLLYKPADNPERKANVGWHTDYGYWKTCTSPNMLTAWVPFHDCDESMGTITMIAGSHLWPDNTLNLDFFSSDLEGLEKRFQTGGKEVVKVPANLKKGEVSFHHCLTIHGSGPNHSGRPRRSIAIHLQDGSNRWQEHRWEDGELAKHENEDMCRFVDGKPDYTDPAVFPRLWPV